MKHLVLALAILLFAFGCEQPRQPRRPIVDKAGYVITWEEIEKDKTPWKASECPECGNIIYEGTNLQPVFRERVVNGKLCREYQGWDNWKVKP